VSEALAVRRKPGAASDPASSPEARSAAPGVSASGWATAAAAPVLALGGVQRKPVIGRPGDAYEVEADAVADRVAGGLDAPAFGVTRLGAGGVAAPPQPPPSIQAMADDDLADESPLPAVQAMTLGGADGGDPSVQRTPEDDDALQRKEDEDESIQLEAEDEDPVQRKEEDDDSIQLKEDKDDAVQLQAVQRSADEHYGSAGSPGEEKDCGCGGTCASCGGVQRAAADGAAPAASMRNAAASAIASPGGGSALPASTRGSLETRMGVDLGGVRVHDGPDAQRSAAQLNARAFTHGRHIWIGRGESAGDVRLMAHEVTHVLQQDGVVRRKPKDKAPGGSGSGSGGSGSGGSGSGGSGSGSGSGGSAAAPSSSSASSSSSAASSSPASTTAAGGSGSSASAPPSASPAAASPAPAADSGGVELMMPEPPAGLSAEEQARLASVDERAGEAVESTTDLPAAEESVGEARGAVQEPAAETQARAGDALVDALGERPAPSPEIEALCVRIRQAILEKRPPDEDSLVNADPEAMARDAGGQLNASVEGDAQRVQGQYDQLQQPPAGAPAQQAQPMDAPPGPAGTPALNAAAAAPQGVEREAVSLDADVAAGQQRMSDAGMDSEPARLVESGPIADARGAHGELAETAARDPQEVMAEQAAAVAGAQADMAALQASALAALRGGRTETTQEGRAQQQGMVGSEEEMRTRAGADAQRIFDDAQTRVSGLLEPLPRTAMARWDAGVRVLSTDFEQHLARVKSWIDERHESTALAIWDAVTGMPAWVEENYARAERTFGDGVCELIREISSDVNGVIAACETIIDQARADIAAVFDALPAELQGWAAEQQAQFGERLDGLAQRAQQTRDGFTRDLVQRASQAVQEVREKIHSLREAAKGLLGRLEDAVNAFLEDPAKFIIDGLLSLVGIAPGAFWALVDRIGQAIDAIADDPMGFANNLMAALGQGFQQFFDNIGQHLLQGLMDWLFSGLGSVGVQIPSDTSLKSIVTFFLQLMGLTWANIRKILAKHIGEENVALIEKAWELVSSLIEMGPEGLFELIREQLDPSNLLSMVLEAATQFMVEALIKAVTPRILLLFNPAGAIVQAIEAIFRVLSWIFNNAARIFSLVETVVGGVTDLIAGNIGGMATAVEGALSRLIPPVIDFLAGYLGMGDLPEKIADVIRGFQQRVLGVVERIIAFLAERAKALLRAMGLGGDEKPEGADGSEKIRVTEDLAMSGEGHTLSAETSGDQLVIQMASARLRPLNALVFGAMRQEQKGQKRAGLISSLEGLAGELREAEEWWHAREHQTQPVEVIIAWINARLDDIRDRLQKLGAQYHVENLINLGHVSVDVEGDQLLESICGNSGPNCPGRVIRPRYYGGFTTAIDPTWKRAQLVANNRATGAPAGHFKDPINGKFYPFKEAEIDHYNPTVVDHWNNTGRFTVQGDRKGFYSDSSALRILSGEENRRLGREETARYNRTVGPDFRGPED
jgi:Domain of unknown function (DUF4157)